MFGQYLPVAALDAVNLGDIAEEIGIFPGYIDRGFSLSFSLSVCLYESFRDKVSNFSWTDH